MLLLLFSHHESDFLSHINIKVNILFAPVKNTLRHYKNIHFPWMDICLNWSVHCFFQGYYMKNDDFGKEGDLKKSERRNEKNKCSDKISAQSKI